MGREIAHYMTHEGAPWLERPEREEEEAPSKLIESLHLKPGDVVADVGAGSGYLSWRMAKKVLPGGLVYGNDIQPEMLVILKTNALAHGLTNVVPVLGKIDDPQLPTNKIDLAILVDVYHECDHPFEIIQALCRSLKTDGRLVFVEYRGEDPGVPIKLLHKMTEAQVRKEMEVQPLTWVETLHLLPRQHIIIFRKKAGGNP
jgi:ubiquinone/menaquinone biosynthesis C-methylase UbiE